MSRSRRVQRSVRGVVATRLLAAAMLLVIVSVVTGVAVGAAAVCALVTGAACCRIIYGEVTQTRRDAGRQSVEQARSFGAATTTLLHEQRRFTASMGSRLVDRERAIARLEGTLRVSEHRAAEAAARAERETCRADVAQNQLSALLDELLNQPSPAMVEVKPDPVPAVVDLLAWEGRVSQAAEASRGLARREA